MFHILTVFSLVINVAFAGNGGFGDEDEPVDPATPPSRPAPPPAAPKPTQPVTPAQPKPQPAQPTQPAPPAQPAQPAQPVEPPAPPPPKPLYGPPCSERTTTSPGTIEKMVEQSTGITSAFNRTLSDGTDSLTLIVGSGFSGSTAVARLQGSYNMDVDVKMCRDGANLVGYIFGGKYQIIIRPNVQGRSVRLTNTADGQTRTMSVR